MRILAFVAVTLAAVAGCNAQNDAVVCSAKSDNAGAACSATYELCKGGTDKLDCTPETDGVRCACIENGTKAKDFHSPDACNVSTDTLKKRAADGCGWKLD
jgi:hypothetical protein